MEQHSGNNSNGSALAQGLLLLIIFGLHIVWVCVENYFILNWFIVPGAIIACLYAMILVDTDKKS